MTVDDRLPLVLVADDDADIRALVAFRLRKSGYDVLEAGNGSEALRLAKERRPALAVLDWMMPGLTGVEVVEHLRADPATAQVPVLLLTARVQEADVARGLEAGADGYLKKPFSPKELSERVGEALASGRRRAA
ncbi:MAG: response regulator [Thermoleophilia bacterium]